MKPILFALLYGAQKPVSFKKLAEHASTTIEEISATIEEINASETSAPWQIIVHDNSAQLTVRPEYLEHAQIIAKKTIQSELTPAAKETLSIIAYRGPIDRETLEQIRGVHCGHAIRILRIKGLIEESETDIFQLTHRALQHLGLQSVADLPEYETYGPHVSIDDIV